MVVSQATNLFWITLFFIFFTALNGERKFKRLKENVHSYPKYEVYGTDQLPSDKQVSVFLVEGESKIFSYQSVIRNASLSITIITCTSPINWMVRFQQSNSTGSSISNYSRFGHQISNLTTQDMQTLHITTNQGIYIIQIRAMERDTYVHIYVSTEPGGPQALQHSQLNDDVLKFLKRQQRKKLTVRWQPSLVDPQVTDYCLVVSSRRHYSTLCSAHGDKYGVTAPRIDNQPEAASQTITAWDSNRKNENPKDPFIACIGARTHFTLSDLRQSQGYYFDLFALNRQSNLTYLYGSSFTIFDKRTKPTRLKDNKSTYVNLKKFDGKVMFRYKVGRLLSDSLKLYITPCGGAVDIDVSLKNEIVTTRRRIEGFGRLVIANPKIGNRYYIKILSSNKEELRRISGVEILVTTKPSSGTPVPNIPSEPAVQEYISLRKCNSVTIGWLASPGQGIVRYCLVVREGSLREIDSFKMPNQCGLENRLKKSADFAVKYCRDIKQGNEQVLTQKINKLKPGKNYIVQVTVKKPKGKTLSYDLLQVQTRPKCDRSKVKSSNQFHLS